MEITEFDEQSETKEEALRLLREKIRQYRRNLETLSVCWAYEYAAVNKGATQDEIEQIWRETDGKA